VFLWPVSDVDLLSLLLLVDFNCGVNCVFKIFFI
jgi:hypothetical protein